MSEINGPRYGWIVDELRLLREQIAAKDAEIETLHQNSRQLRGVAMQQSDVIRELKDERHRLIAEIRRLRKLLPDEMIESDYVDG